MTRSGPQISAQSQVERERQPEHAQRPREPGARPPPPSQRRDRPARRGLLVAGRAPGQDQHAEGDDERRRAARDGQSERDGQVLAPPSPCRAGALSAPRASTISLSRSCDSTSTMPGWSMVRFLSEVPAAYSISCSGELCTCSSPGLSAMMCSVMGLPALTFFCTPLGSTVSPLKVMSIVVPLGPASWSAWPAMASPAVAVDSSASGFVGTARLVTAAAAEQQAERRDQRSSTSASAAWHGSSIWWTASVVIGALPESHVAPTDPQGRGWRPWMMMTRLGLGVRAMSERLRASDLALLADETPQTPMHNATLEIFDPAESGFDYDALLAHIDDRIAFVPRYRQHVRRVPGRLANPVWVDDEDFDLAYHVRRSALPRPGTLDQLRELAGADHVAPARPGPAAVGDLLRRGPRGRPGRGALQVPPDPGRRHLHGRPRPGAARRRPRPAPARARRLGGPARADPASLAARRDRGVRPAPAGRDHARCAATPRRWAAR